MCVYQFRHLGFAFQRSRHSTDPLLTVNKKISKRHYASHIAWMKSKHRIGHINRPGKRDFWIKGAGFGYTPDGDEVKALADIRHPDAVSKSVAPNEQRRGLYEEGFKVPRERTNEKSRRSRDHRLFRILVPRRGLEPPHLAAHGPEPCASTNSAIWALRTTRHSSNSEAAIIPGFASPVNRRVRFSFESRSGARTRATSPRASPAAG
jgi:hypothetical protein